MRATIERLELLPAFVEVVRQGSFTAAAARLGIPKSSVSRRVSRLERELGVALLVRTTRRLRLTEAGADLYEEASSALRRLDEAARALAERQGTPRGLLRVTAPVDLGHDFMGRLVASFVERYPSVRVEVSLTNRIVDLVGEGFDCAIRAGGVGDSAALVARRLGGSELGLFAASRYIERRGMPERVQDLARHDCVVFRAHGNTRTWRLRGPRGEESVEVRGVVGTDDFTFVRAVVRAGAGIGLMPLACTDPCRDVSELVRVLPDYSVAAGVAYFVYPRARHVPAKVTAFREHVVEAFRQGPWSLR
ncbi:MAG TPA: LysR family transcriptional regulator [Sandaracinaceae bacterium]